MKNGEPGNREAIHVAIGQSSLGLVLVAEGKKGLIAVMLGDDRATLWRDLGQRLPGAVFTEVGEGGADEWATQVIRFVESPENRFDARLDLRGSEFQREVWRALREIPVGETRSYTEIANRIGRPHSVRAVASACAANRLAVVVPCHRVVRRDGQLSGYRWGVSRKRELLHREAAQRRQNGQNPA